MPINTYLYNEQHRARGAVIVVVISTGVNQMVVELEWELSALLRLMSYVRYLNSSLYFQKTELGGHENFYIPS